MQVLDNKDSVLDEFVAKLAASSSTQELGQLFQETVGPLGCKYFAYHIIQTAEMDNDSDRLNLGITNYPNAWSQHYIASGYVNSDPVIDLACQRKTPFEWRKVVDISHVNKHQKAILEDAYDAGIYGGWTIPLISRIGESAALSLIPEKPLCDTSLTMGTLSFLHVLSEFFHSYSSRVVVGERLVRRSKHRRSPLSRREREAMTWVARGKSSWEIANILGISEKAVELYVGSAKHKMQAANRTQAVVKAIMLGFIDFRV